MFPVPFLNIGLGFPLDLASGISLMTVIATSSVVSTNAAGRLLMNLGLGMLLKVPATAGALIAGIAVSQLPRETLYVALAGVTAAIAVITLSRLERRNVILDSSVDPGGSADASTKRKAGARCCIELGAFRWRWRCR